MVTVRVPERFKNATMGTLDEKQYKPVFDYLERIQTNIRNGVGILLSGPPGVGKSWAAVALTRAVEGVFHKKGKYFDSEFVTAPDMFERIPVFESERSPVDERRARPWVKTYTCVPWMVMNDLGKEYRGGAMHEQVVYKLGRVLRERSEKKLITVVTTNLPIKAAKGIETLQSVYGESVMSLLSETVKLFHVNGQDRRRKRT